MPHKHLNAFCHFACAFILTACISSTSEAQGEWLYTTVEPSYRFSPCPVTKHIRYKPLTKDMVSKDGKPVPSDIKEWNRLHNHKVFVYYETDELPKKWIRVKRSVVIDPFTGLLFLYFEDENGCTYSLYW